MNGTRQGQVWATADGFIALGSGAGSPIDPSTDCAVPTAPPSVVPTTSPLLTVSETPQLSTSKPDDAPEPYPAECPRLASDTETWVSKDGITWQVGPGLPALGQDPPPITGPIPAPSYSVAASGAWVVVANPTLGATVWIAPAKDFIPQPPA